MMMTRTFSGLCASSSENLLNPINHGIPPAAVLCIRVKATKFLSTNASAVKHMPHRMENIAFGNLLVIQLSSLSRLESK
jgi:hypothetical protein